MTLLLLKGTELIIDMASEFDKKKSLYIAATPRQELSIKKELDDVAIRSIREIANAKSRKLDEEPDNVEKLKR